MCQGINWDIPKVKSHLPNDNESVPDKTEFDLDLQWFSLNDHLENKNARRLSSSAEYVTYSEK